MSSMLAGQPIGLVWNPMSGRVQGRGAAMASQAAALCGGLAREARTGPEIAAALDELMSREVRTLAVAGGDGTVHAVLGHLLRTRPASTLPGIAVIPAGTTNMTAADLGIRGAPVEALARLRASFSTGRAARVRAKPVLRIEHAGQALYGMFIGFGLIASGVRYFLDHVRGRGITGEKASAIVIARYLVQGLVPGRSGGWDALAAELSFDQVSRETGSFLLALATTLDRTLLGLRPYWGVEALPIHATAIRAAPRRMWRGLVAVGAGRGSGLRAEDGYFSRNVSQMDVRMRGDFAVDGELYAATPEDGEVRVTSAGPVPFLCY